ncbi:MAG: zeta toxin family protein [Rhodospirillales bacterium]|nr:zeta toxin family protein [Rhodospirillales bacterium]
MTISQASIDLIYERFLSLDKEKADAPPVVYAMAGVPGAGKSTFVMQAMKDGRFPQNAFILNPDRVMQALPEYQIDLTEKSREEAFERWEMPARDLAYQMFEMAVDEGDDIIKDMGCSREENLIMLQNLKDKGYRLEMHYVHCTPEEAVRRANARGRYTPEAMIYDRAQALTRLLPHYQELADDFYAYDNTDLNSSFRLYAPHFAKAL